MFNKVLAGVLGGIIPAIIGMMVIGLPFAGDSESGGSVGAGAFFAIWIFAIILALISKTGGKAWRKVLLLSAILSFALPLASFLFTGAEISNTIDSTTGQEFSGASVTGTAIGGGIVTAISGFLGFFLGIVFLVIALLTGRDKQVIIVQQPAPVLKRNEDKN